MPVLTATFPLHGALQTLPVTGREPDTHRSPHTTPPRELLTPVRTRGGFESLVVAAPACHLPLVCLVAPAFQGRPQRALSSSL